MKIALAAMSGIRVCDEELLKLGLTLPGFVERSKIIASLPSLGLLTLAGMTPKEHTLEYFEIPDIGSFDVVTDEFDLVAISSYSAQINEAYELSDRCRQIGIATVIGGPHVSAVPDEAIQHCDAVVIGEGEIYWEEILRDHQSGRLSKIYGGNGADYDLSLSPMPAFELLDISKYNRLTVQTSRGCPHRCDFCAGSVILTDRYKQKPAGKVIEEIDKILEIWRRPFIEFADDNTFVNKDYWKDLLVHLRNKNIKWFTETDLSVSEDERLLELMRESGCAQVLIGLESPVKEALKGIEMRGDWKFNRFSKYKEAIETIQSHGITVNGCFIIGLDGHTTEIFDQVFGFVAESGLYEVQVTIMTAFPGTPLYSRLNGENRLLEPLRWDKCTLFDVNFRPKDMCSEELEEGFKRLVVKLYSKEFTKKRRDNFRKYLQKRSVKKGAKQ